MGFLTKRSLEGLGIAGGRPSGKTKVDPFAALKRRRLGYAGRSHVETGMGQLPMGQLPLFRLPEFGLTPPEVSLTPEGELKFEMPGVQPTGEALEVQFPSLQLPVETPTVPAEAMPEMYESPEESATWSAQPAIPGAVPATPAGPVSGEEGLIKAAQMVKTPGEKLIALIRLHPGQSVIIAALGFVLGSMIKSVIKGGVD